MKLSNRPHICALLIDLSGTIHVGNSPTPFAPEALRRLRQAGLPFRFCSNTSKESKKDVCRRLAGMGVALESDNEVWTSLSAVRESLRRRKSKRPYFLLSDSARAEICDGLPLESSCSSGIESPHDVLVVGYAPAAFTYSNLNTAFRILIGEHGTKTVPLLSTPKCSVPIIATHKSRYLAQSEENGATALSLGPGPFIAALEMAAGPGIETEVVGKPSRGFFENVIASFEDRDLCDTKTGIKGRVAMIGDDVEADLGEGAHELGLWRVLVKTGKYRAGDETRDGLQQPDEVCESFAEWVNDLLNGVVPTCNSPAS